MINEYLQRSFDFVSKDALFQPKSDKDKFQRTHLNKTRFRQALGTAKEVLLLLTSFTHGSTFLHGQMN